MSKTRTVRIRLASPGRVMPAGQLRFVGRAPRALTSEDVAEVVYTSFVRRRLERGEFEKVSGPPKKRPPQAKEG